MNQPPAQSLEPKRHHQLRRFLYGIAGLALLILIGVVWTKSTLKDDSNVTAAERQALSRNVEDTHTIALGLIFPVDSRLIQFSLDRGGERLTAYAIEYYTVFGIRMRRVELECWDARPGIDGVQTEDIEPIGTLTGTIWCGGYTT